MIDCVMGFETDAVVFCHFIAINVVVGAANNDDALIVFKPDNASMTEVRTCRKVLRLLRISRCADTRVT